MSNKSKTQITLVPPPTAKTKVDVKMELTTKEAIFLGILMGNLWHITETNCPNFHALYEEVATKIYNKEESFLQGGLNSASDIKRIWDEAARLMVEKNLE